MALDHTPETRPSLHTLEQRGDFIRRHIGPDPRQIGDMLGTLGLATLEALDRAVPASIRVTEPLALAEAKSERETLSYRASGGGHKEELGGHSRRVEPRPSKKATTRKRKKLKGRPISLKS